MMATRISLPISKRRGFEGPDRLRTNQQMVTEDIAQLALSPAVHRQATPSVFLPNSATSPPQVLEKQTTVNSPTFFGPAEGNIINYYFPTPNKDASDSEAECKKVMAKARQWGGKEIIKSYMYEPQQKEFSQADDIASLSTNEIVVLERSDNQLITFLKTNEHKVISQELPCCLAKPSHVSVTNDDHLVILQVDPPQVKIFNRGYRTCLCQFTPGSVLQGSPSCLAVSDKNLIAVGYEDKEKISLHDRNRDLNRGPISVLSAPTIGELLTFQGEQLVYISKDKKKLLAVDTNGNSIFSSDFSGDFTDSQARGLCCDSVGGIYVSVHAGRLEEGQILYFSADGNYVKCLQTVPGYPAGITITPDGNLAVAAERFVIFYPNCPMLHRQPSLSHGL